jgi:hypothetical protein
MRTPLGKTTRNRREVVGCMRERKEEGGTKKREMG